LTESHRNILNIHDNDFIIEEIISKDPKLMDYLLDELSSK